MKNIVMLISTLLFVSTSIIGQPPIGCNNPIVGKGAIIDEIIGGTACLLCGNGDVEDLLDGDLSNFSTFTAPITVLSSIPVISIKDVNGSYPIGTRAGFVVQPLGGVLSLSATGPFQIRTYLNNTLQQTVTGSALSMQSQGQLRRLSFATSQPFDEVELLVATTLGVLTSVQVYYAFVEEVSGCDYSCVNALAPPDYSATIDASLTGVIPICIGCSVTQTARVVNADTTDAAHINVFVGVGGGGAIAVEANTILPAGYETGFAVRQGSGLLDLTLLGGIHLETYLGGNFRESVVANGTLANVSLLGASDINLVSFKTTLSFDEVRLRISGVSIAFNMDVYYAFVRPDDDNDGFANCVDKCANQPDYLDADGDGTPNGCDAAVCTVNAGLDIGTCPPGTTAQLVAAGGGQTWTVLSTNPATATVNASGVVSGMTAEGNYGFVLTQGACHDTVYISRFEATLDATCNNPIIGPKVIVTDPGGADCLLCVGANIVIDGVLSGYVSLNTSTSILGPTTLIGVRDTSQVYPAGRRVGFVVQSVGGLLSATLLSNLQIRTYLNGSLQETATSAGNVLAASALTGDGALQRLSFVTALPFDEVELVATATLNLLTEFRVYYAFEEPSTGCPSQDGESCVETLNIPSMTYCGQISYDRTGIVGAACVGCSINNIGNLVDGNTSNFSRIQLTVGVGASGQISVYTRQTIPAGYTAGFVISGPVNLLDATVLGGLRVRTFLGGVQREEKLASGGLLNVQILNASNGLGQLSFATSLSFDEVQLSVAGLVSALSTVYVYYAFVRRDSDGDGAPDCADKCCGGDDRLDSNGNGVPNFCDPLPSAVNDVATTDEDTPMNISVLSNDSFGDDSPGAPALQVLTNPAHGTATIQDNGTPGNPLDDFVLYTPAPNYSGSDVFTYRICDTYGDCDTATVNITINSVDDLPSANDDTVMLNEDAGETNITALANDSFGGDGPATTAITITIPPTNGMAVVNNNGTANNPTDDYLVYTPNTNYNGTDQITYQICDADGDCDQATIDVTINAVNDAPIAQNDVTTANEDTPVTFNPLVNDTDAENNIDPTSVEVVDSTAHGTVNINPITGMITYTPDANFAGVDTLVYAVCDLGMPVLCDTAIVLITVAADTVAKLQLKVMLQGALIGTSNGLMRDDLRAGGYLPLTEPYTALNNTRFVHLGGGGGETTTADVLAANVGTPNAIVDWVFVELRSAVDSTVVIQTRSALLQRDGDVVSATTGVSLLNFPGKVGQHYYVAVKHRNHLGAMIATPVLMNNDSTLVNFINANNAQVYNRPSGINYDGHEMVTVQGKRALWAANATANNKVKYQGTASDNTPVLTQVLGSSNNTLQTYNYNLAFGYFSGDVNMDGKVKYQGAFNDVSYVFVNIIGLYTDLNTLGLYNYDLFLEQFPN